MLPNVGSWEMIIILLVVFLVFGSKRLPDVARGLGKGMREFKREMQGITDEINKVTQEPPEKRRGPASEREKDTPSAPAADSQSQRETPPDETEKPADQKTEERNAE